MSLLDIRKKFVEISGRYDLVDDAVNFSDKGADFYINAGQKYLDRLVRVPENTATIFLTLSPGDYTLEFPYSCRSVKNVYVNNRESRYRLRKVSLNDLKNAYSDPVTLLQKSSPVSYALANLRALETTDKDSLGTFVNLTHEETDKKYAYRGIIIVPPVDEEFVVEVSGLFSQNKLISDGDENYWTQEAPELLLKAALYELEGMSRGTENAKNWISMIAAETLELGKDFVEDEISDIDAMKG